jgi:hypothetical protein
LFGVPYLLIFVLPNWENIRKLTAQVQDMGGPNALQTHLYSYEVLSKRLADSWSARPLTTLLTYPVLQFKIPAILIATAILLTQPCTRGLAIGGLILPSFVLLFSRHKAIGYTGYYTPEFLLYMVALVIGAIALVELLVKRLLRDNWQSVATWAAAIALAIPVFTSIPTTLGFEQARLTPRMDDLDVGRATGRELLGPNALMPYISGSHWYTAGSDRWYPAQSDLSYPKYTQMDWQAYLAQFEAVAVDDSHWNFNTRAIPVPQWYVQGKLSLRGFFLNNRHSEKATLSSPLAQFICGESGQAKGEPSKSGDRCTFIDYAKPEGSLSYLFLDEKRPTQVIGYGYARDGQLYRFEEENNGEYLFFSGVCASDREPDQTISFFLTFPLDQVGYTNPHVINAILPYQRYSIARQTFLAGCKPREEIRGRLQTVDKQALLEKLSKEDQPIQFFRTLEAAQNGSQEPSTR